MILRNTYFNRLLLFISVFVIHSCNGGSHSCILRIKFDCTPSIYVDHLKLIMLTDSFADLGGGGGFSIFGPGRVLEKNVKRSRDNNFYLQGVRRAEYAVIYMEGYIGDALFLGSSREVDFSSFKGDTAEVKVCFKPGMLLESELPYVPD